MDRWRDKVAVVTGASAGIGAVIVRELLKNNIIVVALARRQDVLNTLQGSIPLEYKSRLHFNCCDVRNEEEVKSSFEWIKANLGGVDILINNAGVLKCGNLVDPDSTEPSREIIDTNVMGILYCTREAFNSMKERKVDGHIIMINSLAGHRVPPLPKEVPSISLYSASKFAVTAMVETYRQEFLRMDTKVKVTSISPGAVKTDMLPEPLNKLVLITLNPEDVSDAVLYALSTPPHVQVREIMLDAVGTP